MKQYRLLWFLSLLVCISLACNLPGQELVGGNTQRVNSVSLSPHSGAGSFRADVRGEAYNGTHILRCYVSTETGNETIYTQSFSGNGNLYQTFNFNESFTFTYTVPGTHSLVCLIDDSIGNAWSEDFVVVSTATFTPTSTPTDTPTITPTATQLTTLVLNGTFKLPEAGGTCNDGTQYRDPSAAVSGTLVLTVNYTNGQASASLLGTGQATESVCDFPTMTITRTIPNGATLSGTIDPNTNALTMTGDVTYDYQSTCWIHDVSSGTCSAGGQTQTYNMTLNGSIDPAQSTGAGQIQWTGNKDWGNWQVP